MADPPPHHCKDCGLVFDSSKSLDVHLHYHKENLLSKWAQQPSSDESNNNHVKKNNRTTAVPADSSDSTNTMSADRYYQHHIPVTSYVPTPSHEESTYVLGGGSGFPQLARTPTPNSCSSQSPHHQTVPTSNSYRFHPYQQYSVAVSPDHHRNGNVTSSSPQQCEKCGFVCESGSVLMEHLSVAHPPTPSPDIFDHGDLNIKIEPGASQAEILDLDSHKVHVYQPPPPPPPPPQEHSVSALMSWVNNVPDKERFHPQNGSGLSSPDCYGNVSTTTVSPPDHSELLPHQQPTTYQYDHISQLGTNSQQQISSTQIPMVVNHQTQNKMLKPGSGSWKANDARRPKTYNCSACNKWFTSSGHLKRHYNTTLHKNAVKQSGAPDPATMPISAHHHPHKDPNYMSPQSPNEPQEDPQPPPPPQPSSQMQQQQQQQQQPPQLLNHHFLPSPPNLMAGPSEVTGGLLLHTTPYQEVMSPTHPTATFLPFPPTHTYPPPQHPNFLPPHVSTDPQVTNNISGNMSVLDIQNYLLEAGKRDLMQEQLPLPSFSQFQNNNFMPIFSSFHPVVSSSDSNVGGLSPDQISSNFDSIYHPQSPSGDSYSLENIHSSIDGKPFNSPSSSSNSLGSNHNNNNEAYTTSPSPDVLSSDVSIRAENTFKVNRFKLKNIKEDNSVSSTISPPPTEPRVKTPTPTPIHRCVDCDKVFNKACYLTQHNKSFHSGVKPYKCERCGKRFTAEYLHQEHLSKHAGEKPYKCEICPKQFNHKTDLRRHMCLHTGDKPYACDYCGKGFIRKDHMLKHCETHKRRPSGQRFQKQNTSLIESLKQHHQQQMQHSPQATATPPPAITSAPPTHNPAVHTLQLVM
ncbi:uncharacterized protein LOC142320214 [Lycorma delicatula]|uniref:uncharacterized protein LOC142320214 n=1 Tax=Lycorma delicatula TaxID=130591 RepID=UPI003F518BCB